MISLPTSQVDIEKIAVSDQTLRIQRIGAGRFAVVNRDAYAELVQEPDSKECRIDCTEDELRDIWAPYFDLDTDYQAFRDAIDPEDTHLAAAADFCQGVRILRQDPWETICANIIAQNNSMVNAAHTVADLCRDLGRKHVAGDVTYFEFPEPTRLIDPSLVKLFGIGYRTPHLTSAARSVFNGTIDLDKLASSQDKGAIRRALTGIAGIGPKVAANVELCAFHDLTAYPLSTKARRVIETRYPNGFDWSRYAGFEGVIYIWLLTYERKLARVNRWRYGCTCSPAASSSSMVTKR